MEVCWHDIFWIGFKHTSTHFPSKPFVSPYTLYDGKLGNNTSFAQCFGRVKVHNYQFITQWHNVAHHCVLTGSNWAIQQHCNKFMKMVSLAATRQLGDFWWTYLTSVKYLLLNGSYFSWDNQLQIYQRFIINQNSTVPVSGISCVLHGLIKCQMKMYFKEPIHQEIYWRLLLTN